MKSECQEMSLVRLKYTKKSGNYLCNLRWWWLRIKRQMGHVIYQWARNGDGVCAYIIMKQDQIICIRHFKSVYAYLFQLPYILWVVAQLGCLYIFVPIAIYIICTGQIGMFIHICSNDHIYYIDWPNGDVCTYLFQLPYILLAQAWLGCLYMFVPMTYILICLNHFVILLWCICFTAVLGAHGTHVDFCSIRKLWTLKKFQSCSYVSQEPMHV